VTDGHTPGRSGVRQDTSDALLREVAAAQSESRLPSLAAGVVRDGELVWTATRGRFANRDGERPTPDTQYRIGSISKTFTAVLVMQCRDDGLLALSDPVGKHLPGVPFGDLTVRQLLAHSGGMNAEPAGDWWERNPGLSFEQLAAAMDESATVAPPDRRHHYSNLGYGVLGELVSRLRSAGWMELVQRRILDPLELRRTTYLAQPPAAQGFSVHPFSGRLDDEPAYDAGAMAPAGQLWSTVQDLGRYVAFWLDPPDEVLSRDTVDEMATPQAADPIEKLEASYGLGLRLVADGEHLLAGHTGSMPGFLAGLFVDRDRGIGAVTLANATTGRCSSVPPDLIRVLAEHEPHLPDEWLPEATIGHGEELLGPWFWGNTPHTFVVSGGVLVLVRQGGGRESRFVPHPDGGYTGLDGYFAGERLWVIRTAGGGIDHLDLATFILTRTPYGH
jgi:CubicO group peptidase (beta-lactamase class C family)